jgi:H+/Cl- antiporter ClcA
VLDESIQQIKEELRQEAVRLNAVDSASANQQDQRNIAALQEALASAQSAHASLVQFEPPKITIEQPARRPTRPIRSPPVPQTLLLAAVLGLILGLVGAFFMESRAGGRAKEQESAAAGGGN